MDDAAMRRIQEQIRKATEKIPKIPPHALEQLVDSAREVSEKMKAIAPAFERAIFSESPRPLWPAVLRGADRTMVLDLDADPDFALSIIATKPNVPSYRLAAALRVVADRLDEKEPGGA